MLMIVPTSEAPSVFVEFPPEVQILPNISIIISDESLR